MTDLTTNTVSHTQQPCGVNRTKFGAPAMFFVEIRKGLKWATITNHGNYGCIFSRF